MKPLPTALTVTAICLGVATGARHTLGIAGPLSIDPSWPHRKVHTVVRWAVLGELIVDKLPGVPSRIDAPGPASRVVLASLGEAMVARKLAASPRDTLASAVLAGAVAAVGCHLGVAWRRAARGPESQRPDWPGALAEDALAVAAALAARAIAQHELSRQNVKTSG